QALDKVGATVAPRSDEPSVKAVLSKVALGEADAGIVYATDAAAARAQVDELLIPDAHNVVASYAIAALDRGDAPTIGAQFVAYVNSPAARAVLAKHGFAQP